MISDVVAVLLIAALGYWLFLSSNSQIFGLFPYRKRTKQKIVALTFDDGPNEPFTTELLDILKKENVHGTFFVVGKNVQRYPEVLKRIHADGHVVANHSLSHQFSRYFIQPSFQQEIVETQNIIHKTIGKTPNLFRPPWLFRTPFLFKTLKHMRLQPVSGVFCHSLEVFQISGNRIAKAALAKVRPGSILIFHDGRESRGGNRAETIKSIELVVESLKKQGYSFTTVDKLLNIPAYK